MNDLYFMTSGAANLLVGGFVCFFAALTVSVGVSMAYEYCSRKGAA